MDSRPATVYPLLVLRQNIYTDPQKPIQVEPGLYEINAEDRISPLVTTNFYVSHTFPSHRKSMVLVSQHGWW